MISTNFTLQTDLSPQQLALQELIRGLLVILSDKEQFIIQNRFALEGNKMTLEEIGRHFGVTRERVRQIEKTALSKLQRNLPNTNIMILTEYAKALLQKEGGVVQDAYFKAKLLQNLPNISKKEVQELHLALCLDTEICYEGNTLSFHPYWRSKNSDESRVKRVIDLARNTLEKGEEVIKLDKMAQIVSQSMGEVLSTRQVENLLRIAKDLKLTENSVGLSTWRDINPKTLRDKINYIFNREKRPLHFEKIAKLIQDAKFDQKRVNVQAVHNELIRHEQFVLVGRGIYAHKDWGYKPGTVAKVIEEFLSDGTPRTREEITKAVFDQRMVKSITVYLNLKNNPLFSRVGRDKYTLSKLSQ